MADFSKPTMGDTYVENYNDIKANTNAVAAMFKGVISPVNLPQYAVKLDNGVIQRWNGSAWLSEQLQIQSGGTGAATAAGARTNLSVYSKAEINALESAVQAQINGNVTSVSLVGGDLTSGTLHLAKVGRVVTLTWTNSNHASSTQPSSAPGVIPAAYRPVTESRTASNLGSERSTTCRVSIEGTMVFFHTATGTTTDSGSISYVSAS